MDDNVREIMFLIVEQLKAVGESKTSLMLLDRGLGKRGQ